MLDRKLRDLMFILRGLSLLWSRLLMLTVKAWVPVACLSSLYFMLLLLLQGNSLMSDLIVYSAMFCASVFLEASYNRGQLELLCRVSHNMLGPEPTIRQHFLHLCMNVYDFCLYKLPL